MSAGLELRARAREYRDMNKLALSLLVILAFSPSVLAQGPLQKVVVTYSSRSIASVDLFIAQDRGFFKEEGLAPQLVQVRATATIAAIVSGEVHALRSIGSAIRAIPRGAPISIQRWRLIAFCARLLPLTAHRATVN